MMSILFPFYTPSNSYCYIPVVLEWTYTYIRIHTHKIEHLLYTSTEQNIEMTYCWPLKVLLQRKWCVYTCTWIYTQNFLCNNTETGQKYDIWTFCSVYSWSFIYCLSMSILHFEQIIMQILITCVGAIDTLVYNL